MYGLINNWNVHTGSRAHKKKECVHELTSCLCVLTSLPGDGETDYSRGVKGQKERKTRVGNGQMNSECSEAQNIGGKLMKRLSSCSGEIC